MTTYPFRTSQSLTLANVLVEVNVIFLVTHLGTRIYNHAKKVTFAFKQISQDTYPNPAATRYQGRFRGRVFHFYNSICPVVSEYVEKTDWVEDLTSIDNAYNEFCSLFTDNGFTTSTG